MTDRVSHWLNVRDKAAFLHRLMAELAGDARISLEGDLSRCRFPDNLVVSREEDGLLKRNTVVPRQTFVVLRLTPEAVAPIFHEVMAAGLKRAIVHVQIERNGVLELMAYDNFHPECVATGPGIRPELLNDLKSRGVIRDFSVTPASSTQRMSPLKSNCAIATLKMAGAWLPLVHYGRCFQASTCCKTCSMAWSGSERTASKQRVQFALPATATLQ